MTPWTTTLRMGDDEVKLLVISPAGDDLIKARLPRQPRHPRALLTLLEGVALWSGEPLNPVISAGSHPGDWLGCETWGGDLWPAESPLFHFEFAIPPVAIASPAPWRRRFPRCPSAASLGPVEMKPLDASGQREGLCARLSASTISTSFICGGGFMT